MKHKLDHLGDWATILDSLQVCEDKFKSNAIPIAPCMSINHHKGKGHIDCQIFEWLEFTSQNPPSSEEYSRISQVIQKYLSNFQPDPINWKLIKELVSNGKS